MCFDFIYNFCLTFLTLRRILRNIIINLHTHSCKVPVTFARFSILEFSHQIFAKSSNIRLHENSSSGEPSCSTHAKTDIRTLIATFCNFVKAPNMWRLQCINSQAIYTEHFQQTANPLNPNCGKGPSSQGFQGHLPTLIA